MTIGRRPLLAGLAALPLAPMAWGQERTPRRVAVSIRDFGARGDGSDQTAAFRRVHAALFTMQRRNDRERATDPSVPELAFHLTLPPGRYDYAWNRWTWGLRRITVEGYGAVIRCVTRSPFTVDQTVLHSNREHYWVWDGHGPAYGPPGTNPEDWGLLIRTARPGDRQVTLASGKAAPALRPGAWVLIQSYAQQQDGYPPNMRYFERVRLEAVDGPELHLDRPLQTLHKDDWPEHPTVMTATGRARVVAIDRPDCPLALEQTFRGLTAAPNPNHEEADSERRVTVETLTVAGALRAVVEDCRLIAFLPTQVAEVVVRKCRMDYTEPDKLIDSLLFEDCAIQSLQQCTGINRVTLRRCAIGRSSQFLGRAALIEDSTFAGTINLQGPTPTRSMVLRRCRFDSPRPFTREEWITVRIGAEARPVDGRTLMAAPGTPAYGRLVDVLQEGSPVLLSDAGDSVAGTCIRIDSVNGTARFTFDLPRSLRPGDRLEVPRLLQLSVTDCTFADAALVPPYVPDLDWGDEVRRSSRLRLDFATDRPLRQVWLPGRISAVEIAVTRPYGGKGGRFLVFQEQAPQFDQFSLSIDLATAGQRRFSESGVRMLGRDQLFVHGRPVDRITGGHYLSRMIVMLAESARGAALDTQDGTDEAARGVIEADIVNPLTDLCPPAPRAL
ncbi:MAG TPA: hypothetical protein VK196_04730 [Magnetospirillum sp.]|nr:hypothetical protein [Magnetospirillum sp.]